jgi:lipoprotein-anchoring transpeptidase ErfK/SrfK
MHGIEAVQSDQILALLRNGWARRRGIVLAVAAAAIAVSSQTAGAIARGPTSPVGSAAVFLPAPADEQQLLEPQANALLASVDGNLAGLRAAGQTALATGRNQATVAAFLRLRWVSRLDAALEHYGELLQSASSAQLALGAAGVRRYSELIDNGLRHDGPTKLVVVSLEGQRLIAYDRGKPVLDTLITTGRATLPTDVGTMFVWRKDSPWTMQSPWPKGSPYWYPDTQVQMVAWFTKTGEGLHDAAWEPASAYGPGSPDGPFASHGCIHVPPAAEALLYPWITIGTPVVVYPGDGTPLASQARRQSVDAVGNPVTGARGA